MYNNYIIANCPQSVSVIQIWKLVSSWQR